MPFAGRPRLSGPHDAAERPLTVAELNTRVKRLLEAEYPDVWVEGAISRPTNAASGHFYFGLQDETARVDGVMWAARVRTLAFRPADGMQVRVRGQVTLYPPGGRYQLVVNHMEPAGLGARELILKQLRERLRAEGLLDPSRKRALPPIPRRIALVTSPTGAAVRDLIRVILRRFPRARLLLVPVKVQGDGAASDVADGLRRASLVADVDVAIVGRGGGSAEDLWAFNEEPVARAIFGSRVPVISAVGHEIDTTLADEVADVRAATPSQAGELVVPVLAELDAGLRDLASRSRRAVRVIAREARAALAAAGRSSGLANFRRRIDEERQHLDALDDELRAALRKQVDRCADALRVAERVLGANRPTARLAALRKVVDDAFGRMRSAVRPPLVRAAGQLLAQASALKALDPVAVLGRGFSLTWVEANGVRRLVRDSRDIAPGARIRSTVASGDDLISEVREQLPRAISPRESGAPDGADRG